MMTVNYNDVFKLFNVFPLKYEKGTFDGRNTSSRRVEVKSSTWEVTMSWVFLLGGSL